MAALQKIRSKGSLLIIVIGLALFAFIAEEFFRSLETTSNENKQQVGEIYGDKLSVKDYQAMVDEFTEAVKMTRQTNSLSDAELNQLKDQVWQTYLNYQLIKHEADKLGMTVTDAEMEAVISQGTNEMLLQTPFRNEKTGMFDATMLKTFLKNYEEMQSKKDQVPAQSLEYYQGLFKFWTFVEKTLRQNLLIEKFQVLLAKSFVANPIAAKNAYEARVNKSDLLLASVPYASINDKEVSITDNDLKAKYNEKKEMFKQYVETRDIKFVEVAVTASPKDRADLDKDMADYYKQLTAANADVANIVRLSGSLVNYVPLPVSKPSLPSDISARLDSIALGSTTAPFYSEADNTLNIVKVSSKVQAPDSIQFRQISVQGATVDAVRASSDSIYKALQAGADFETIAKTYKQTGEKAWLTSAQYERSQLDDNNTKYVKAITTLGVNAMQNLELDNANIIIQVVDRRAMTDKYEIAVVKRTVDFSKDTYRAAYNSFSHFIAANPTVKEMEANAAKSGYAVQERLDLQNNEHYIARIENTREALKWVFEAKDGEISPLYECGANDHLLVIALLKVHETGYRSWEDVKDALKSMVLRDKKAEKIMTNMSGVKSIAEAQKKAGVLIDTVQNVSFAAPTFVKATGTTEPILGGSVCKTAVHKFAGPLKGNNGVYMYQVVAKHKDREAYNEKSESTTLIQTYMQSASRFLNDLYLKANVKDKRYLFF
ncbi:MAG: peptidylprolyl isomerase [Bacteroidaceae bacterium]